VVDISNQVNHLVTLETNKLLPFTLSKRFDTFQPASIELKKTETIGRKIETPRKTEGKRNVRTSFESYRDKPENNVFYNINVNLKVDVNMCPCSAGAKGRS
jgi:hypothetical protein